MTDLNEVTLTAVTEHERAYRPACLEPVPSQGDTCAALRQQCRCASRSSVEGRSRKGLSPETIRAIVASYRETPSPPEEDQT